MNLRTYAIRNAAATAHAQAGLGLASAPLRASGAGVLQSQERTDKWTQARRSMSTRRLSSAGQLSAQRSGAPLAGISRGALLGSAALTAWAVPRAATHEQQQARHITLLPSSNVRTTLESDQARRTPTLFQPRYTEADLRAVSIRHFEPENVGDRVAMALMRVARWGFDLVTRYNHPEKFPRIKKAAEAASGAGAQERGGAATMQTPMYDPRRPSQLRPEVEKAAEAVQAMEVRKAADHADLKAASASASAVSGSSSAATARTESTIQAKADDAQLQQLIKEAQPAEMTLEEMREKKIAMTPEQWLIRIVFLE